MYLPHFIGIMKLAFGRLHRSKIFIVYFIFSTWVSDIFSMSDVYSLYGESLLILFCAIRCDLVRGAFFVLSFLPSVVEPVYFSFWLVQ